MGMAALDIGTNFVPGDMINLIREGERAGPTDNAGPMETGGAVAPVKGDGL
jgi:hypothetical protein